MRFEFVDEDFEELVQDVEYVFTHPKDLLLAVVLLIGFISIYFSLVVFIGPNIN